jgi:hypothetical protein
MISDQKKKKIGSLEIFLFLLDPALLFMLIIVYHLTGNLTSTFCFRSLFDV